MVAGIAVSLGNGHRGRIDHDHAQKQQKQGAPEQRQIDFGGQAARGVEGWNHRTDPLTEFSAVCAAVFFGSPCSACTAATKTSARWA